MYVMRSLSVVGEHRRTGVEGNAGARFGFGSTPLTDHAQRAGITYYVTTTIKRGGKSPPPRFREEMGQG